MNEGILKVAETVSNEKGLPQETIFQAIETAMAAAIKKSYAKDIEVRVSVDRGSGDYDAFRCWEVMADGDEPLEFPDRQIYLSAALEKKRDIREGEFLEEPMPSVKSGRISAQIARQFIVQKLREAERGQVVEVYRNRVGQMVSGIVKSTWRSGVVMDLGDNAEGFIPRSELIPRENMRPGDRVRCYLKEVRPEQRGPQLILSRTDNELLIELFRLEVPEINEGLIKIVAAARKPGSRSRLAVRAIEPRIDPIGACVGMRGSRVQSVSNELAGERVDIVQWEENPAQYVLNAMIPADIVSVVVDEDMHTIDLISEEDSVSKAIGRDGENVKLASELTGWELNVISVEEAEAKQEMELRRLQELFREQLAVDEEVAHILAHEGFSSVEEISYVPEDEILAIEEFDENLVKELRMRAKSVLLDHAIRSEVKIMDACPADDLLSMEGMDRELAYQLASRNVVTMEDLAEQSVDELLEIDGMDEERAGRLIMTARQPWFVGAVDRSGHKKETSNA